MNRLATSEQTTLNALSSTGALILPRSISAHKSINKWLFNNRGRVDGWISTVANLWLEFSATQPKYRHDIIPEDGDKRKCVRWTRLLAVMDPDVHALTESELYVLQEEKNMFQFHIYNTNQKYSATDEKRCFTTGAPVGQIGGTMAQILQGFLWFKIKMWSMWGVCLISQIYWLLGEETSFTLFCFTVKPFIWLNCSVSMCPAAFSSKFNPSRVAGRRERRTWI